MTDEEYKAAIEQYKAEHSAGGSLEHGEWKKHKYIRIENGRYIYPDDLKKTGETNQNVANIASQINRVAKAAGSKERINGVVDSNGNILTDKYGKKFVDDLNKEANASKKAAVYTRSEMDARNAKKAAADAMKAGRTATQQYKESGQYEKDVADEKAKREAMARQEETKKIASMTPEEARKRAAELTKQNTPESKSKVLENDILKYTKKGSSTYDKAMEKINEILSKNPNAEVEVSLGENRNGIDMRGYLHLYEKSANKDGSGIGTYVPLNYNPPKQEEADQKKDVGTETPGMSKLRDMSVDAQDKAKKEAERKKTGYSESNEALAKKYNLSDGQIESALKSAEHKKYLSDHNMSLDAHKKAAELDGYVQETSSGWFIADRKRNLVAKYEKTPLEDFVKDEIEAINNKQKIQHSYTDPKSFYAAVYDYKQAHKR